MIQLTILLFFYCKEKIFEVKKNLNKISKNHFLMTSNLIVRFIGISSDAVVLHYLEKNYHVWKPKPKFC